MNVIHSQITLKFPIFDRAYTEHSYITTEFANVWREVPEALSEISLMTEYGALDVFFDWEKHIPMIIENNLKNYYTLEDYFLGKYTKEEYQSILLKEKHIDLECYLKLHHPRKNLNDREEKVIKYCVENLLFQIFLAVNLSTPGSFSCFSPELIKKENLEIYDFTAESLESVWIDSINNKWPQIGKIKLDTVWKWMESLELGTRQIAQNRTERVLFSILHICRERFITPNQLIWISLALEALYDTPKAQINKTLLDRILLFLEIPIEYKKQFKKKITQFYDLRSRFVHGDFDIANPLANHILDEKVNDYQSKIVECCDFGLSIVLATLQKMIINGWNTVEFKENYIGIKNA